MIRPVLCIGPFDGEWRGITRKFLDRKTVTLLKQSPLPPISEAQMLARATEFTIERQDYKVELIKSPAADFKVLVHASIDVSEAFRKLLAGYKP